MACRYTSKTAAEIKVIIGDLEDSIVDANLSGNQKIDYNNITYEIKDFVEVVEKQLSIWAERLCIAEEQEGTTEIPKRFTRFEGYC